MAHRTENDPVRGLWVAPTGAGLPKNFRRDRQLGGEPAATGTGADPRTTPGRSQPTVNDTIAYVVSGVFRVEPASGVVHRDPGDVVHVPAHTVHRESNPMGETAEVVLARRGTGPMVVNVDGPA